MPTAAPPAYSSACILCSTDYTVPWCTSARAYAVPTTAEKSMSGDTIASRAPSQFPLCQLQSGSGIIYIKEPSQAPRYSSQGPMAGCWMLLTAHQRYRSTRQAVVTGNTRWSTRRQHRDAQCYRHCSQPPGRGSGRLLPPMFRRCGGLERRERERTCDDQDGKGNLVGTCAQARTKSSSLPT